jgi:drug/metabolite transporter (DMT)-like permease
MAKAPFSNWTAICILCGLAIVFSGNHIAARFAFNEGVSVITAVSFRSGGTALALTGLITLTGGSFKLPSLTLKRGVVIGLLIAVQSVCIYTAVALVPVGLALLVFNLFPICFLVFNRLINKAPISKQLYVAVPIIVIGLTLALNPQSQTWINGNALLGLICALGAAIAFGLALTLTEKWMKAIDGRLRSLISLSVVALVTGCAALVPSSQAALQWALPQTQTGWAGLIGLTAFYGSAFAALFILVPRLNMPRNASVMNIEPIFALTLGWLFLGQHMSLMQWLGAFLVIVGIIRIGKT